MLLKPSALTLVEAKSFLRVDYDLDDFLIEMMLESAKGYVQTYTKRSLEELDEYPEIAMAILVLTSHFYDNPTLETDTTEVNYTIGKLLGTDWYYMSDSALDGVE